MKSKIAQTIQYMVCPLMLLVGCASLHTGAGKVSTDGMVKITKKRIPMDAAVIFLCVSRPDLYSPHTMAEADIYANHTAIEYRKKSKEIFLSHWF